MRHWASCRLYVRIKPCLFFVAVPSSHVHHAKVAIVMVIHGFPPNHRHSKSHCLDLPWVQKAKSFNAIYAHFMAGLPSVLFFKGQSSFFAACPFYIFSVFLSFFIAFCPFCHFLAFNKIMSKRKCIFRSDFTETYSYIIHSSKGSTFAHCTICRVDINISCGGISSVKQHIESVKHSASNQWID